MSYAWENTAEHKRVVDDAIAAKGDVHTAVAVNFGVTRAQAKHATFRILYAADTVVGSLDGSVPNHFDPSKRGFQP